MEACCRGDPLIPNYLYNGADPNGASSRFEFPLPYVINSGQPLEFITKLVNARAHVLINSVIEAIKQRPDMVACLLGRCRFECRMEDLESALRAAQDSRNKKTIALNKKRIEEENE